MIFINFFRRVFYEYTEANDMSYIPLDSVPEICAFIVGFSLKPFKKGDVGMVKLFSN